ncbi:MAG: hypothetical protein KKE62_06885, partial [Proteobacteria bacterium]|nr:hypothetical protein [Pseudomonadota bacterium]MBU1542555.1 hypothetical protein [Pseudomonadota bacterium]MBU2479478.1 hypothetical protein [Pseudomonadota bacterium]
IALWSKVDGRNINGEYLINIPFFYGEQVWDKAFLSIFIYKRVYRGKAGGKSGGLKSQGTGNGVSGVFDNGI